MIEVERGKEDKSFPCRVISASSNPEGLDEKINVRQQHLQNPPDLY